MIALAMWYYSKNGMQLGPLSTEELSGKARGGEVSPSDLVWKEGMPDWKPLAQVPEFQSTGGFSNPPPVGMGSVPIPQPTPYPASQVAGTIPNYLWQSIVATVVGALTCWLIAMPLGIVAIVYAAKVEGLQARGDLAGATTASKSAKVWMIASFSTLALCLLLGIAIFAMLVATGELNK